MRYLMYEAGIREVINVCEVQRTLALGFHRSVVYFHFAAVLAE